MVLPLPTTADLKIADLRKCGEIKVALILGKHFYAFNCIFCDGDTSLTFPSFENFMLHMEEHHFLEFDASNVSEENDEFIEQKGGGYFPAVNTEYFPVAEETENMQRKEVDFSDIINEDKMDSSNTTDPLDMLSFNEEEYAVEPNVLDGNLENKILYSDFEDESMNEYLEYRNDNHKTTADIHKIEECSLVSNDEEVSEPDAVENDVALAIIEGFKEKRLLWDGNDPYARNHRKRQEALQKLTDGVNEKLGVRLKVEKVRLCIRRMRDKFKNALQNRRMFKSRDRKYTPLWYYNKMEFLIPSIKRKQRKLLSPSALESEDPILPISNLTGTENLELIDIYKSFPCLWDTEHIGYHFKIQQQNALDEMLEEIRNKMNLYYTQDELQKVIVSIQYACTQEKQRKFHCDRMHGVYEPYYKFYENISFLEDHVGPFKCVFCEEILSGLAHYKIHKSKHDGTRPFICSICNQGFVGSGNYKIHLRRHIGDLPYECNVCGKAFATASEKNVHMRTHTGEKPCFCEVCGRSFRTSTFFSRHMRRHQKRPMHKCTLCPKEFYESCRLKEHMNGHLNVRDKVCNICGKGFTTAKYLRQHKEIHAEKKKYTCAICSKNFAQYSGLSGHMKSHGTTMSGDFPEDSVF